MKTIRYIIKNGKYKKFATIEDPSVKISTEDYFNIVKNNPKFICIQPDQSFKFKCGEYFGLKIFKIVYPDK